MQEAHKVDFFIGQLADGKYAAASINAPYFCFTGDSEDAVVTEALEALEFYFTRNGKVIQRQASGSSKVLNFVPQQRKEYAYA